MFKYLRFLLLFLCLFAFVPRAEAFDPVTLAILAPIAIRAAQGAAPYVARGAINLGKGCIKIGKDSLQLLRLPWGLFQMGFLWHRGSLRPGLVNVFRGLLAPFKMVLHALLLPIYMFGVETNF